MLNAYTLAFGGLLLLGGRLGDVFGRRRLFEIGVAVFTLASLARRPRASRPSGWSPPAPLQGVGAALAAPGVLALLTTSAPDEAGPATGPSRSSAPSPPAACPSGCCSAAL